jgi:hypothetical protein
MFYGAFSETLKCCLIFFLIKTHKKKIDKIEKPIQNSQEKSSIKINITNLFIYYYFFFFMNPYLIDTSISNNTHQKNCQKTHKKKHIHLFKYKDICFCRLIGLILPYAYYIRAY